MARRRPVGKAIIAAAAALSAMPLGCGRSCRSDAGRDGGAETAPPPADARARSSPESGEDGAGGILVPSRLAYLERRTGSGAEGAPVPLVVALHGLGDEPRHFIKLFDGFEEPARVVVPCGPDRYGEGFSWMPPYGPPDHVEAATIAMADKIAVLIRELETGTPARGKAIVTGFSMGGVLAFVIAARHPDRVGGAVPIAGHLPRASWPASPLPAGGPALRAFNGDADPIVSAGDARAGIAKLASLGLDARIRLYSGAQHTITTRMRADVHAALGEMVRHEAGLDPRGEPAPCEPCPGEAAEASCSLCR